MKFKPDPGVLQTFSAQNSDYLGSGWSRGHMSPAGDNKSDKVCNTQWSKLDPVVQSLVSLTISLRHKFVKQISAKVTNTLLFFVEKM